MNPPGRYFVAGLALVASVALNAQQSSDSEEGEPIELSPFVISEGSNVGYRAMTTMAGTRLNTELRDVGASISVLTPELFDDTGATDAATILSYAANTEVVGVQGNYTGGNYGDAVGFNTLNERRSPQNAQRVRGLSQAALTRNFFLTDIPFDTYNTASATISRGPNSLLYGLGEPGGVIDNSLQRANSSRNFGKVSVRIAERGSHREVFDYNLTVKPRRLGLRLIAMNDEMNYQQTPTYRKDRRVYGAIDAVILENERSSILGPTVLRGNFETGEIEANPPNIIPPADNFSDWFRLPIYSPELIASYQPDGQLPPTLNFLQDGTWVPKLVFDNGISTLPSNAHTQNFLNNMLTVFYDDPTAQVANARMANAAAQGFQGFGKYQTANPSVPGYPTHQVSFQTLFPLTQQFLPNFTQPVVMDKNVVDNERMSIAGDTGLNEEDFDAVNFALEQTFFDGRAGLELVYDKQNYSRSSLIPYTNKYTNRLSIDLNQYLPNMEPNPNVGRLFISSNSNSSDSALQTNDTEREAVHLTGFYELDFTENDGWSNLLGSHNFTAFYAEQEVDQLTQFYRAHWYDVPGGTTDINRTQGGRVNGGGQRAYAVVNYVSDSLLDPSFQNPSDVRLTGYVQNPYTRAGDIFHVMHMDTNSNASVNPATGNIDYYDDYQVLYPQHQGGNSHTYQEFGSTVVSWQGRFFDDNLVTLYGLRRDRARSYKATGNDRLPNGEYDPANLELDPTPTLDEVDTSTFSVVAHVPREWMQGLPFTVSAHYSQSENSSVAAARVNSNKEPLPPPGAKTQDYGLTFEFLENRVSLRLNWYEIESTNATLSGLNVIPSAGGWTRTQLVLLRRSAEEFGYDQAGFDEFLTLPAHSPEVASGSLFQSWDDLFDAVMDQPNATQNGNQYTTDVTDDVVVWLNPPVGAVATQDYVGEGMEIELIGNITRNWRVSANIAEQTTVTANTAQIEVSKLDRDLAAFNASNLGGVASSSSGETETLGDLFYKQLYNPIVQAVSKDGVILPEQRQWRANLVSSYQFDSGFLDGFMVGGAIRWQGKAAIGYPQEVVDQIVDLDVDNPFYDDGLWNGDIWLAYTKRLKGDRSVKFQLNVRNIIGDDDYIPTYVNPDGRLAVVRNSNPQEVSLTTTFFF